jgi:hypothetical protein
METLNIYGKMRSILTLLLLAAFFMTITGHVSGQDSKPVRVSGTVADYTNGELLPGVNVSVKGTQTGSVTDVNGKYILDALQGSVLVFSFVGYESTEITVGSQTAVNIRLKPTIESLDEVVVIGYGLTTKKEITGSIASVKAEDFNKGTFNNPMGLLQGKVAGLSITQPNGADPQAGYQIIAAWNQYPHFGPGTPDHCGWNSRCGL